MTKKNEKISPGSRDETDIVINELERACDGLVFVSETDSAIVPFASIEIQSIDRDSIIRLCKADPSTSMEVVEESAFFRKLTEQKEWFGPREVARADRFSKLRQILLTRLTGIKVFRVGTVRIEIILAGHDKSGRVTGIRMSAVET